MSIRVKFFASLREQFSIDEASLESQETMTVNDVWQQVTASAERPANVLMAVNMEYVDALYPVKSGDEVAFFPPVTGG